MIVKEYNMTLGYLDFEEIIELINDINESGIVYKNGGDTPISEDELALLLDDIDMVRHFGNITRDGGGVFSFHDAYGDISDAYRIEN